MKKGQVKIILALVVTTIVGGGFFFLKKMKTGERKDDHLTLSWSHALDQFDQVYRGDFDLTDKTLVTNCPDIEFGRNDYSSDIKACHPLLFNCYFKGRTIKLKMRDSFLSAYASLGEGGALTASPSSTAKLKRTVYGMPVVLNLEQEKLNLLLNDDCRMRELPAGAYKTSEQAEQKDNNLWHTSGFRYFIDTLNVRRIDIREWLGNSNDKVRKELRKEYNEGKLKDALRPAVNLLPEEMMAYCKYRGAEVLNSFVRAAVTYHHGRKKKDDIGSSPPSSNTATHPFGIRMEDSPQYNVSVKKESWKKEDCQKIFSSECLEFKDITWDGSSVGWSGIKELLGGYPEFVINTIHPRKNIHPSSFYYSIENEVHNAGKRIFWDGRGHKKLNFNFFPHNNFKEPKEGEEYGVSFRCMKRVPV